MLTCEMNEQPSELVHSRRRIYPRFVHRIIRQLLHLLPGLRGMWRLRNHVLNIENIGFPAGLVQTQLVYGQKMWIMPNDLIGRYLFYQGIWEGPTARHFYEGLRAGDTVLDIGANIGQYTVLAGTKIGVAGLVFAVEPSNIARDLLEKNIALNKLQNVQVLAVAAWDADATLYLDSGKPNNCGSAQVTSSVENESQTATAVVARRLEPLLRDRKCKRIDVLKIDIEGSELPALRGLEGYFAEDPPRSVYCELLGGRIRGNETVHDLLSFFDRFGYKAWVLAGQSVHPLDRARIDESTMVNLYLTIDNHDKANMSND